MIQARALTKHYGRTVAVDGLSFDVEPGRVTGFLGPNGAGKSTTMRLILGLDHPTSGTVTVLGRRYRDHFRPLHDVGAVLEAGSVHGGRSAYHHLLCLAQSNGIPRRRVTQVLDVVGLTDVAGRRVGTFSLGMSQRLSLAAALLGDPPVILCDEPVNGLDPEGIRWMRELLRGLAAEGRTVFVSSHLLSEMALTADQVIVVGRGRLLADTSVASLVANGGHSPVRVRTPGAELLATALRDAGGTVDATGMDTLDVVGLSGSEIGDLALRLGVAVHELTPQPPSLEAAFLDLTQEATQFRAVGSTA
ncbi:MAG TPA: ATP-binding cassette domain-containing protein [Jatrophihabitantaceae bacterium]|nr:ATP-binding cassette domain-containing protein [Jatrophihabitantaceae bacterium]